MERRILAMGMGRYSRLVDCVGAGCAQRLGRMGKADAMTAAKTAAQRQAERKARQLAAGLVQWKRWVHPDDVPALSEYADKLARKRARSEKAG